MKKRKKHILTPISPAELIDKITILEIKAKEIADPVKNKNVCYELAILQGVFGEHIQPSNELNELMQKLRLVSLRGWKIEDHRRACEINRDFGPKFVKIARAAFQNNRRRMALWKEINLLLKSEIIQEKSHSA